MDESAPPKPTPIQRARALTQAWAKAISDQSLWTRVNEWTRRAAHPKIWVRVGIIGGAVFGAFLFFVAGIALRLMMGPIDLGPFTPAIRDTVNSALSGLVVKFDNAQIEWSRGSIHLSIKGTRLFDVNGRPLVEAPYADLDFDQWSLLTGKPVLTRFVLRRTNLAARRTENGAIQLGLAGGPSDFLDAIRKTLIQNSGGESSLSSFKIIEARLAYHDAPTGLFLISTNAALTISNRSNRVAAVLDATVDISGSPAQLHASAELSDSGAPSSASIQVTRLNLAALARNSRSFAFLRPFDIATNFSAGFTLAADGVLVASKFMAEGTGKIGPPLAHTGDVQVERARIAGFYDAPTNRLVLNEISLTGNRLRGQGQAEIDLVWSGDRVTALTVKTGLRDILADIPSTFAPPLALERITVEAAYDREAKSIVWQRVAANGGPLSVEFEGEMDLAGDRSPAIRLQGTAGAIGIREMLAFWPRGIGNGARTWIDENTPAGRLGPFRFQVNIPVGALENDSLPEEALLMTFPMEGGTAQYMKGLTFLTGIRGEGILTGDTFRARLFQGNVGPLRVTNGEVVVSTLHMRGPPGQIRAHVSGKMADLLRLIDMKPLEYAKAFHIDPAATAGSAELDLDFRLPMLDKLDMDQVRLDAKARVSGLVFPLDEKRTLEAGEASFAIDGKSLTAEGTANVGALPLRFKWVETFAPSARTTVVDIEGTIDDASRERLGLIEPTWLTGPMRVSGQLYGRRFNFTGATLRVDLHNAAMRVPSTTFEKAPGTAATLNATFAFDRGRTTISGISFTGTNMSASGSMTVDEKGDIVAASLASVRAGPNNDFSVVASEIPGGGTAYRITGRSFDASRLLARPGKRPVQPQTPQPVVHKPFQLDARLDQVVLRDGQSLRNVNLGLAFAAEERLTAFSLDAIGPAKGRVTGRFASAGGVRAVTLDAEDASQLIRGLSGLTSLKGGSLAVRLNFPTDAAAGDYRGTVTLNNVTVMNQPFIARLFAIGSLDGPLRLLQGEGIRFTKVDAPFSARGKVITVTGGRASGSAVGFTFDGTIDRQRDAVNMRGTLVPVYGLNSIVSNLPILGQLLASREGEGIFGLTYAVRGDVGEPEISVNPLSLVTPGILRRIFEYSGSTTPRAQAAPRDAAAGPPTGPPRGAPQQPAQPAPTRTN